MTMSGSFGGEPNALVVEETVFEDQERWAFNTEARKPKELHLKWKSVLVALQLEEEYHWSLKHQGRRIDMIETARKTKDARRSSFRDRNSAMGSRLILKFAFFVIWYSLLCTMGLQIWRLDSGADWEGAGFHHFRLGHIRRRDWGRFIGVSGLNLNKWTR